MTYMPAALVKVLRLFAMVLPERTEGSPPGAAPTRKMPLPYAAMFKCAGVGHPFDRVLCDVPSTMLPCSSGALLKALMPHS